jgi:hypothetical protein
VPARDARARARMPADGMDGQVYRRWPTYIGIVGAVGTGALLSSESAESIAAQTYLSGID